MKKTLFVIGAGLSVASSAADETSGKYDAQKWIKERAESSCSVLAGITLPSSHYQSLVEHAEPEVRTRAHENGYMIGVNYPYRTDGVSFVCVFRDYRDGTLQLQEFGTMREGSEGSPNVTHVKPLW